MSFSCDSSSRRGFTFLEIAIALAILGILVALAISSFEGINEKYKVEGEVKQLYADLMDARGRAMQRNRFFHVRFTSNGYQTYEDGFPAPDGDNIYDNNDVLVTGVLVKHAITTDAELINFTFDRNGISSVTGLRNIWFSSSANPDYNCITVQPTRIKMGQWNGVSCDEK